MNTAIRKQPGFPVNGLVVSPSADTAATIPVFWGEVGALLCVRTIVGIVGVAEPNDTASLPPRI